MSGVRRRFGSRRSRPAFLGLVVGALLFALLGPSGIALGSHVPAGISRGAEAASSLVLVGTVPSEVVVGAATGLTWEAVDANGSRVASFAAACGLTITVDTNGSNAPSWVNASVSGPLGRAANGTYSIPSTAWRSGELRLFVVVGKAASVTVDLVGSLLPANRAAAGLVILPDLDHLVLYDPEKSTFNITERWDDTFWHVRDPFGDPVPGAVLTARTLSSSGTTDSLVPVVPLANGSSGAWLNYSFPKNSSGSWEVLDAAGAVLLGPVVFSPVAPVSSNASAAAGMIAPISPELLGAIVLVFLGGVGGIVALVSGGSPRAARPRPGPEDELRRLAEGRETVVELLRRKGPLSIEEIEASWEPAPAPAAVADWVASLVTDGTLTATLGEGGKARFTLAARPEAEPRVTLDEDELARGIARRDAAVETDEEGDPSAP